MTLLVLTGAACGGTASQAPPPPAPIGLNGCPTRPDPDAEKVEPTLLEGRRIAGDPMILLTDSAKKKMSKLGLRALQLRIDLCLTDEGVPFCINYTQPSGDREMDAKLIALVRRWRYEPYRLGGKPVEVCTEIIFNYRLQ